MLVSTDDVTVRLDRAQAVDLIRSLGVLIEFADGHLSKIGDIDGDTPSSRLLDGATCVQQLQSALREATR
jgi:hypothetical protein